MSGLAGLALDIAPNYLYLLAIGANEPGTKDKGSSQTWARKVEVTESHTQSASNSYVRTASDDVASNMKTQRRAPGKQPVM